METLKSIVEKYIRCKETPASKCYVECAGCENDIRDDIYSMLSDIEIWCMNDGVE